MSKRYDSVGKPIGRTRNRLAEMLTAAFRDQLGMDVEIDPATLRKDDWDGCWFGTFWREMPWGGYRAVVSSGDTMGECVKRGVTVSAVAARVGSSDNYKAAACKEQQP